VNLDSLEVARLDDNLISNIEDLAGTRVIDNGDADYTSSGWLQNVNPAGAAFEGDYEFRNGSDDDSQAVWTFKQLDPGVYEVLLTYVAAPTHSDDVTVVVKGADTASVVESLPLFTTVPTNTSTVPLGGHTVTINTDAVGTDQLIVGDDSDANTFYGTAFTASVVGGLTQIVVYGDLVIPGDTIKVIGSRPLSIVVGNDVRINANAVFDVSAVGTMAGPGGGSAGGGGSNGTPGTGGTGGFGNAGGSGGSGGGFLSSETAGSSGLSSSSGTGGSSGTAGQAGQAGGAGFNNSTGGGVAGSAGGGGFGGSGGLGRPGGAGGGISGTNGSPGAPGQSQWGVSGQNAGTGGFGGGGINGAYNYNNPAITGGGGGAGGGGGGGGG
ncbi:MAG: hypothetical protein ACREOE_16520, partial [Gemmatimonadales bacterium]